MLPNQYRPPKSNEWTRINDVAHEGSVSLAPNLDIFVIAGVSGVVPGRLGQPGVNLKVGGELYSVTQVVLEKPLGKNRLLSPLHWTDRLRQYRVILDLGLSMVARSPATSSQEGQRFPGLIWCQSAT